MSWIERFEASFNAEPLKVFTLDQVRRLLEKSSHELSLPYSLSAPKFLEKLLETNLLITEHIKPETTSKEGALYKTFIRYVRPGTSTEEIALLLRPGSYLSHGSAAFNLGLLSRPSDLIYANKEQSPKHSPFGSLTQASIDRAFSNAPRISNYVYRLREIRLMLLNGKHTGDLGVLPITEGDKTLRQTSLERTLIDVAVRPAYAGGIYAVQEAFTNSATKVDVHKLVKLLKELGHVYPYHQAIGFYLQSAGLPRSSLTELAALGLHFDFYLANRIPSKVLDRDWRIYIPADLVR